MLATEFAIVPFQDTPIMPALPVDQSAFAALPSGLCPVVRLFSQSMTALVPSTSRSAPTSLQPVDRNVPGMSTNATAYPRGTK